MKQFINRKCFPLIILLLIIGLILVVGFLLGFRITYAPELENSWNAISSVATWAGVIVSVASAVASFMAVLYAVRVADYQNRIALFEKRYELYEIVFNFCTFSDSLKNATNALDIRMMFLTSFCYSVIDNEKIKDSSFISAKYVTTIQNLKHLPFLFVTIFVDHSLQKKSLGLIDFPFAVSLS